jgi:hypothetical protein
MVRRKLLILMTALGLILSMTTILRALESIPVNLAGLLQTLAVDEIDRATGEWKSNLVHYLKVEDGEWYQIEDPQGILGTRPLGRIFLSGKRIQNKVYVETASILAPDSKTVETVPETVPETVGEQKTLVALFNYPDKKIQPFTLQEVKNKVINNPDSVDNFIKENSYGKAWINADFIDWQTLPNNSTDYTGG